MKKLILSFLFSVSFYFYSLSQEFETVPPEFISTNKPLAFKHILGTRKGPVLITETMGLAEVDGNNIQIITSSGPLTDDKGNKSYLGKNANIYKDLYEVQTGIKLICEGLNNIIYVVSEKNNFGCFDFSIGRGIMYPPFNFPLENGHLKNITQIYLDKEGTLFVATNSDSIYYVSGADKLFKEKTDKKTLPSYIWGLDKDSNLVVTSDAKTIQIFTLGPGIIPHSFFEDPEEKRIILIGTNKGLYGYDKQTGQNINYYKAEKDSSLTITDIYVKKYSAFVWFSTLEKGLGRYNTLTKSIRFYEYPKKHINSTTKFPIEKIFLKSENELFVAVADSIPAVFNVETGNYTFITDSIFSQTKNETTDIKTDAFGRVYITKGGGLFWSKTWLQKNSVKMNIDSSLYGPYLTDIMLNGSRLTDEKKYFGPVESLKEIQLKANENTLEIYYSCRGINADSLVFSWKLDNFDNDWKELPFSFLADKMNMASFDNLKPGKYIFRVRAKSVNHDWLKNEIHLSIIIAPPYWQTWWFWLSVIAGTGLVFLGIIKWRVGEVRKEERVRVKYEKAAMELEAKALRAQMNPHFIFNCMNSIKSLIQQHDPEKAVTYLTTFSKLLRTILQNSDKREISLFDEIETCRLYTQLESMRFGNKFSYTFSIDASIDLKSIRIPALIVQPFIENAIWHGIMPKDEGGKLEVTVKKDGENICCIIDDNGIGREMSKQNKFKGNPAGHESKGVHLTQSRLDLDNVLNKRNAYIEITDKKDEQGIAKGTTVMLTFKEY